MNIPEKYQPPAYDPTLDRIIDLNLIDDNSTNFRMPYTTEQDAQIDAFAQSLQTEGLKALTHVPSVVAVGERYRPLSLLEDESTPDGVNYFHFVLGAVKRAGLTQIRVRVLPPCEENSGMTAGALRAAIDITPANDLAMICGWLNLAKKINGWGNKEVAIALGWDKPSLDAGAMKVSRYVSLSDASPIVWEAIKRGFIDGVATANLMRGLPLESQQRMLDLALTKNIMPFNGTPVKGSRRGRGLDVVPLVRSDFDAERKRVPLQRKKGEHEEIDADTQFWLEVEWVFDPKSDIKRTPAEIKAAFTHEAALAGMTCKQAELMLMRAFTESPGMMQLLARDAKKDNRTFTDTLVSLMESYSELT